ncbi:MAG: hypothetical protein ACFFCS_27530 [Candidatus Hodarchaeota archaeon]
MNNRKVQENPSLRKFINRTKRYQDSKTKNGSTNGSSLVHNTKILIQSVEGLELENPVELLVLRVKGLWLLKNEGLNIHVWGKDLKELKLALADQLEFLREEIWKENDIYLDKKARELKKKLDVYFKNENISK